VGKIKDKVHVVIFGTDTRAGKGFDVALLWIIIISVLAVVIESVTSISSLNPSFFTTLEWVLTIIFTIEYALRVWSSYSPKKYIFSFWGAVDLLSVVPTYLTLVIVGAQYFLIVRILRLMRVFRILKLTRYNSEASVLIVALKKSRHKISVFLLFIILIVFIMGTLMYVVEGKNNGFTSIPESIYWCIVTITTVGYGDIVPKTFLGKLISSISMILGYAIIAIPTGIVSVALHDSNKEENAKESELTCDACQQKVATGEFFCKHCGHDLKKPS
jgi:voltage-gated potassium channel